MNAITQLRYQALLKRLFSTKGNDPGQFIDPIVKPVAELHDVYQPENRFLRGEANWQVGNNNANTNAANFGYTEIVNEVNSGMLTVVKRVTWTVNGPTSAQQTGNTFAALLPDPGPPVGFANPLRKDFRFRTQPNPTANARTGTASATRGVVSPIGLAIWFQRIVPQAAAVVNVIQATDLDIVLPPGFGLTVLLISDVLPSATYTWDFQAEGYERWVDPSEFIAPP